MSNSYPVKDTHKIPARYPLVNRAGIIYFAIMEKRTKLQTQIRMTAENQARFRNMVKARKVSAEELVMAGLDALERRNEPSQADIIDWIKRNTK